MKDATIPCPKWNYEELQEASVASVVDCVCKICGMTLRGEPDATTLWCDECDKVVLVWNPVEDGIIGR